MANAFMLWTKQNYFIKIEIPIVKSQNKNILQKGFIQIAEFSQIKISNEEVKKL